MVNSSGQDVLIIGAGPVGLTLACELARHGVSARIVERRAAPITHSHAGVVHVRTLEVLDAMGAVGKFLERGFFGKRAVFRAFGKRLGSVRIDGVDSPYPGPCFIWQSVTEQLLIEHLQSFGRQVDRQVEAVGLEQDAVGVRVRLRHLDSESEEEADARWVVGCEGGSSLTRDSLQIPFQGERYAGEEFLMGDVEVRWAYPSGTLYAFITPERMFLVFPFDEAGRSRVICARPDQDPNNKQPPTLEELQQIAREVADGGAELSAPKWLTRFRSQHRLAARFREGRAFLAGDSGHIHLPIGGQGMNVGMQDAFNLAWKLAGVVRGELRPEVLDTYQVERHPVAEALVKGTDRSFHAFVTPSQLTALALKTAGPVAFSFEAFTNRVRDTLAEIRTHYRHGPLSEDHGGSRGPMAGDRAPDAQVVGADRKTARLFDFMRGTHWTLLLFGARDAKDAEALASVTRTVGKRSAKGSIKAYWMLDADSHRAADFAAETVLLDYDHLAHEQYGVHGPCLYLIRPDWYVGFRGRPDEEARLVAYLERVFA